MRAIDNLRPCLEAFDALIARRLSLGVLMLERHAGGDEARALALTALADAVPFAIDARRVLMTLAFHEQATPLGSEHLAG